MKLQLNQTYTILEMILEDGTAVRKVMSSREYAGFKRSKLAKQVISRTTIGKIELTVKLR